MKLSALSRSVHKWLTLFVGLQLLVWAVTGFYMVAVDLDLIHGDPLVRNLRTPLNRATSLVSVSELASRYPQITQVALHSLPVLNAPVYELTAAGRRVLVDAANGQQLSPLSSGMVRQLARSYYAGRGQLRAVQLLEHLPMEIRGRSAPLWRADFDDWLQTTLYLHPDSGALIARRHRLWRWYDFLWMLHIMDYGEREAPTGIVPRLATALGAVTVVSGVWLLYFSFWRPRVARA